MPYSLSYRLGGRADTRSQGHGHNNGHMFRIAEVRVYY